MFEKIFLFILAYFCGYDINKLKASKHLSDKEMGVLDDLRQEKVTLVPKANEIYLEFIEDFEKSLTKDGGQTGDLTTDFGLHLLQLEFSELEKFFNFNRVLDCLIDKVGEDGLHELVNHPRFDSELTRIMLAETETHEKINSLYNEFIQYYRSPANATAGETLKDFYNQFAAYIADVPVKNVDKFSAYTKAPLKFCCDTLGLNRKEVIFGRKLTKCKTEEERNQVLLGALELRNIGKETYTSSDIKKILMSAGKPTLTKLSEYNLGIIDIIAKVNSQVEEEFDFTEDDEQKYQDWAIELTDSITNLLKASKHGFAMQTDQEIMRALKYLLCMYLLVLYNEEPVKEKVEIKIDDKPKIVPTNKKKFYLFVSAGEEKSEVLFACAQNLSEFITVPDATFSLPMWQYQNGKLVELGNRRTLPVSMRIFESDSEGTYGRYLGSYAVRRSSTGDILTFTKYSNNIQLNVVYLPFDLEIIWTAIEKDNSLRILIPEDLIKNQVEKMRTTNLVYDTYTHTYIGEFIVDSSVTNIPSEEGENILYRSFISIASSKDKTSKALSKVRAFHIDKYGKQLVEGNSVIEKAPICVYSESLDVEGNRVVECASISTSIYPTGKTTLNIEGSEAFSHLSKYLDLIVGNKFHIMLNEINLGLYIYRGMDNTQNIRMIWERETKTKVVGRDLTSTPNQTTYKERQLNNNSTIIKDDEEEEEDLYLSYATTSQQNRDNISRSLITLDSPEKVVVKKPEKKDEDYAIQTL